MAVLKHIAIKNADYSAAVCYLKYQHDERHLKPLLDENGNMMLRSEFHMNGVNCNPDTFDLECEMLNDQYRKNYRYDEVKSHHYIISFDPRDKDEHNLTGEKAQTLGLEFVKEHLPGHQALVCTHMDGHNGSGNIHVHIIINSLRKLDIEPPPHTTRTIDCKAGYKHHLTKDYPVNAPTALDTRKRKITKPTLSFFTTTFPMTKKSHIATIIFKSAQDKVELPSFTLGNNPIASNEKKSSTVTEYFGTL